jgi:hypothetical protein
MRIHGCVGLCLIPLALLATACQSVYQDRPPVMTNGRSQAQYQADLQECQDTAVGAGQNYNVPQTTVLGTLGGAGLGAAAGAIGGNAGMGAAAGALAGLVLGGGYEAVSKENTEKRVVRNCLNAKGYTVLD